MQPTASLAVLIYNFSGMPFENQIELAWAASLVLVMIVLFVNIISRLLSGRAVLIPMVIESLVNIVGRLRGRECRPTSRTWRISGDE